MFWINYFCEETLSQVKIIKSRYRSPLTTNIQNTALPLWVSYRKLCLITHQLRSTKVNEKLPLIVVNCFGLKRSFFNWKNCTFICYMLLCYFYISLPRLPIANTLCTAVDSERFLPLEHIAHSRSVAIYGISGYADPSLQKTDRKKYAVFPIMHLQHFGMSVWLMLVTQSSAR